LFITASLYLDKLIYSLRYDIDNISLVMGRWITINTKRENSFTIKAVYRCCPVYAQTKQSKENLLYFRYTFTYLVPYLNIRSYKIAHTRKF